MDVHAIRKQMFAITNDRQFNDVALEIFHYQYGQNPVYRQFVDGLGVNVNDIRSYGQIPFLPVGFFKTHRVVSGSFGEEAVFESSGTTGSATSRHYVADFSLYEESFTRTFNLFYGDVAQYNIYALLPSYLERKNSSLVYMVDRLLWKSNREYGGFYLHDLEKLAAEIREALSENKKVMLLGVTYALLDLAEKFPMPLTGAVVVETGGMKGRREEITRSELHEKLMRAFATDSIHSEYGMTELLSQAWSKGGGLYACPPWMKVLISDTNDPLSLLPAGRTGGINVIDLANLHSCSFIATQDLGKLNNHGQFEVLGRFDSSDIRGCSLLTV
ncbi:MAG TPA: acyltransferase [Bacteroidales bacterium]|nr:acyltransferase [Bacteroidales bacterium]